ncbi:FabD/lysophospholipase-like protein [Corynespora cassiicola Philippines]|uniref:FabD/lysophospholipase-like protein n=1 Tax=Corynespora cassiicola Philippines TaxID=1448308 RepID=A0A2T2NGS7_CORCC|nr:FabD/lysophospholipase-like protein [Corynespora cassiicola Philippines]
MSHLEPPIESPRRPLSIMTTATSATARDKTGHTWSIAVNEDNCWEDLILTLDGGGIRGYSSLLILKDLMHEVAECEKRMQDEYGPVAGSTRQTFNEDELLPCHYFDFMYGTSTGGLIAVMLARLRMTVPQCLDIYRQVGNDLFGHRRNLLPLATKYSHKPLERAVKRIVKTFCKIHDSCDGDDWHPWEVFDDTARSQVSQAGSSTYDPLNKHERICQSICLTATHSGQIDEAYLLRSYDHRYDPNIAPVWVTPYNEGADQLKIWQVTRATSAAPFFFEMLVADVPNKGKTSFKDGGIRENNPSYAAYSEHASLRGDEHEPALLLSVGTGRPDTSNDGFASVWPGPLGKLPVTKKWSEKFAVFKNVLIKYTEGEEKHKTMRTIAKGEHRWYKRLNVDQGLEDLKLDNWEKGPWKNPLTGETKEIPGGRTLTRMETATRAYLDRDTANKKLLEYAPPKVVLQQVAERLVRHRRLREATKSDNLKRWQSHMGQWMTGDLRDEDAMLPREMHPSSISSASRRTSQATLSPRRSSQATTSPRRASQSTGNPAPPPVSQSPRVETPTQSIPAIVVEETSIQK